MNTQDQNELQTRAFASMADHYRSLLEQIEGVIGTPRGAETDLNTLPARVTKAVVRVPEPDPVMESAARWHSRTPGPLLVRRDDSYIENWRVVKMLPDGPAQVAGAFTVDDATLFAAAPEMLAALEVCVDRLLTLEDAEEATDNDLKALAGARAAIAKAKGQW